MVGGHIVALFVGLSQVLLAKADIPPENYLAAYFTPQVFTGTYQDIFRDATDHGFDLTLAGGEGAQPGADFSDPKQAFVDFEANFNDGVQANRFIDHEWADEWGFSFWFKRTNHDDVDQSLIGDMDAQFNGAWTMYIEKSEKDEIATCGFAFSTDNWDNSHKLQKFGGLNCNNGDWHHFVMTGNSQIVKVYFDNAPVVVSFQADGTYEYDIPAVGNLLTTGLPLYIGGAVHGAPAFKGDMKDIFILNQFLSAEDVYDLYHSTTIPTHNPTMEPTVKPTDPPTLPPSVGSDDLLAAWLEAETIYISVFQDASDHGNDLSKTSEQEEDPLVVTDQWGSSASFADGNVGGLKCDALDSYPFDSSWGFSLFFRISGDTIEEDQALLGNFGGNDEEGGWGIYLLKTENPKKPNVGFAFKTLEDIDGENRLQKFDHLELPEASLNDWHMLTMTGNGDYVNFYYDNELVYFVDSRTYNQPAKGMITNSRNPVFLAGSVSGYSPFRGEMKNIRIYNKFLSEMDVDNIWSVVYTKSPTAQPTSLPTAPTMAPTIVPTPMPTHRPSPAPQTAAPSAGGPTFSPSPRPTAVPTAAPTEKGGGTGSTSSVDQANLDAKNRNIAIGVTFFFAFVALLIFYLRRHEAPVEKKDITTISEEDFKNLSPYDRWQMHEEHKAAGIASPIHSKYKEDHGETVITIDMDGGAVDPATGLPVSARGGLVDAKSVKIIKTFNTKDSITEPEEEEEDDYSHYGAKNEKFAMAMGDHLDDPAVLGGGSNPLAGGSNPLAGGSNPLAKPTKVVGTGPKKKALPNKNSFRLKDSSTDQESLDL